MKGQVTFEFETREEAEEVLKNAVSYPRMAFCIEEYLNRLRNLVKYGEIGWSPEEIAGVDKARDIFYEILRAYQLDQF